MELLRAGPGSVARLALGAVLVLGGAFALLAAADAVDDAGSILLAVAVTVGGLGLLLGPWVVGLLDVAGEERRARIRSEERADIAAELHDSVLQTLALIQRSAPSRPTEAVALARRQERELRSWLYGDGRALRGSGDAETLAAALEAMAAEVEADHGVEVEVVAVGDHPLDQRTAALVAAAREAIVNAARHAGVTTVDCYAEVAGGTAGVYVRDRGRGFDPDDLPGDRHGIAESITRPHGAGRRAGDDHLVARRRDRGRPRGRRGAGAVTDDATTPALVRTFLVDDHRLFLAGVQAELEGRVDVVGTAVDVDSAIAGILESDPEVVLLDVHLPGGGGRAVLQAVLAARPDVRFLALSVSDAAEDVIGVIRGGARGYVTKTIGPDELVAAVERVHDGDAVFSPRLAGFVLDAFAGRVAGPGAQPRPGAADAAGAGGASAHRPGLHLPGARPAAGDLGEDRRDPRLGGAAQAPAVDPAPAGPVGDRPRGGVIPEIWEDSGHASPHLERFDQLRAGQRAREAVLCRQPQVGPLQPDRQPER